MSVPSPRSYLSLILMVSVLLPSCLMVSCRVHVRAVAAQTAEETAVAAIFSAGETLAAAYETAWEAEKLGVDVTSLLDRLDAAGESLAEATQALGRGEFAEAVALADSVKSGLVGFESEVAELVAAHQAEWTQRFYLAVGWSLLGVVLVGVLGYLGWRVVKQRWLKRVLEMKPEVPADS